MSLLACSLIRFGLQEWVTFAIAIVHIVPPIIAVYIKAGACPTAQLYSSCCQQASSLLQISPKQKKLILFQTMCPINSTRFWNIHRAVHTRFRVYERTTSIWSLLIGSLFINQPYLNPSLPKTLTYINHFFIIKDHLTIKIPFILILQKLHKM